MTQYIHINENLDIKTGQSAKQAILKENDQSFLSTDNGITHVSYERWLKAQFAERKHWIDKGRNITNDRNDQHFQNYDGYASLRGQCFNQAIELGCGSFTNMRLIGSICRINRCSLLDPLIMDYINHPFCTYDQRFLYIDKSHFLPEYFRKYYIRGRRSTRLHGIYRLMRQFARIPVDQLYPYPLEDAHFDNKIFDLIVIINVIEHCYNIDAVFEKILDLSRSGSYLVFHDKYYDHEQVAQSVAINYDAAHPLRIDRSLVDNFLSTHFDTIYKNVFNHHSNWLGTKNTHNYFYYIGKRR